MATTFSKFQFQDFLLLKGPNGRTNLFLFLKNNIHLNNTLSSLMTLYLIKPMNFNDLSESDETFSSQTCRYN